LWETQNKDRHGADSNHKAVILKEQAARELRILCTYQDKVLHKDKTIFKQDIHLLLDGSTHYIWQWINTNQPVILKSKKNAKLNATLHVCPIHTYFLFQDNLPDTIA
jgi:hypothetical protein